MELCLGQNGANGGECFRRRAGYQEAFARRDDAGGNRGDLIRALSRPENHLREPLPHPPVVIDAGETEVFERRLAQNLKDAVMRRLRRKAARLNVLQEVTKFQPRHGSAVTTLAAPR